MEVSKKDVNCGIPEFLVSIHSGETQEGMGGMERQTKSKRDVTTVSKMCVILV